MIYVLHVLHLYRRFSLGIAGLIYSYTGVLSKLVDIQYSFSRVCQLSQSLLCLVSGLQTILSNS
ncbi:hypothetical protein CY34DRAFT_229120 [Suillus luteus UH-Slu-Lm8-n1]|uniref:Uncharacterized protein n=1 Tax=Suillus luteus UH-Slu-Lm8-n1 TaxID=930992 RepID=A0A0D0AB48_9AGAM|nr:hypothetical protein CY34DRAFT_229120 [Suillus luteus UH-Slu-Lm8-n1]